MRRHTLLRPGLALSPDGSVHRDPWVWIHDGLLVHCGGERPADAPHELECRALPEAILLPGFVNAHAHLSLTPLNGRMKPTEDFWQWMFDIVSIRASMSPDTIATGIAEGLHMALAEGTTTILDFTGHDTMPRTPMRHLVAHESLAFQMEHCAAAMEEWTSRGSRLAAPHAVYSTTPELLEMLADQVRRLDGLFTIHLSETEDENQLWQIGASDGMTRYFEHFGIDRRGWKCPRCSPTQYLSRLSVLGPHTLLVHCCHLSETDVDLIRTSGASVCVCPATNRFFNRGPLPVNRLMAAGIPVCLGTDSLASSPTMSMWEQMRIVAEEHPDIDWPDLLAMITSRGTEALRLPGHSGMRLEGSPADLVLGESTVGIEPLAQNPREMFKRPLKILDVLIAGRSALAA